MFTVKPWNPGVSKCHRIDIHVIPTGIPFEYIRHIFSTVVVQVFRLGHPWKSETGEKGAIDIMFLANNVVNEMVGSSQFSIFWSLYVTLIGFTHELPRCGVFLAVASRRDGRSFRFGGKGAGPGRRELGGSQTFKLGSKVNEHVDTVTFVYLCRNLYGI